MLMVLGIFLGVQLLWIVVWAGLPCIAGEAACGSAEHWRAVAGDLAQLAALAGVLLGIRAVANRRTGSRRTSVASAVPAAGSYARPPYLPSPLPPEGLEIAIQTAYHGGKGMPRWWAWGYSQGWCSLQLYESDMELRVFRKQRRRYDEIESADVLTLGKLANQLILSWKDSDVTFGAGVKSLAIGGRRGRQALADVVRFLAHKGAPLTGAARQLLAETDVGTQRVSSSERAPTAE